jgi:hypothetical protein
MSELANRADRIISINGGFVEKIPLSPKKAKGDSFANGRER